MVLGLVLSFSPALTVFATTTDAVTTTGCAGLGGSATGGGVSISGNYWDFKSVICRLEGILGALVPLLIGLGMIYFIWGVISYVIADDEAAKASGRNRMIFGIIGFTVIIFVWGLVAILGSTLGLNSFKTKVTFPRIDATTTPQ